MQTQVRREEVSQTEQYLIVEIYPGCKRYKRPDGKLIGIGWQILDDFNPITDTAVVGNIGKGAYVGGAEGFIRKEYYYIIDAEGNEITFTPTSPFGLEITCFRQKPIHLERDIYLYPPNTIIIVSERRNIEVSELINNPNLIHMSPDHLSLAANSYNEWQRVRQEKR